MAKSFAVVVLTLIILTAALAQTSEYDILKDGNKVGSCKVEMDKRGGGFLIRKNAQITQGADAQIIEEAMIVNANWLPESYDLNVNSDKEQVSLRLAFNSGNVSVAGKLGMGEVNQIIATTGETSIWSDRISITSALILLPRVDYSVIGQINEFPVVLPEKLETGIVTLTVKGSDANGFLVHGTVPGGWEFDVSFDPQKNYIARYSVKGGYELVPAKAEKASMTDLPKGYNPLPLSLMNDADFLANLSNSKNLTGGIAFVFPPDIADRLYLNRFSQEFAGVISAGEVSGRVESKKMGHKVKKTPNWPLYYDLRGVEAHYSMPERDIDSDDPQIIDRAEKTVKPAKTLWDAARAINLWVYRNIEYAEITGSASETFKTMKGDSRAKALVCAALCRAAGIPARIVTGIIYAEGPTDHTWVEVYLGEEAGWGPIDPTLGEADRINAAHISLWLGTPQPPVYAKDVALDGVNVSY
jgi:hypothetical protein